MKLFIKTIFLVLILILSIFANTIYSRADGRELINLLWTKNEISNVYDIFPKSEVYYFDQATETKFKAIASNAKILHFATHTIINNEDPMYSQLILSPDKDGREDGYINTFEIYNMQLHAELVVLSACNSGIGKLINSEGIMSLARGFKYAGCSSVILSLWAIDDKSTSKLITYFYDHLTDGNDISNALRYAKLEYIQNATAEKAAPYYWAGLTGIGKNKIITKSKAVKKNHYIGMIVFLTLVLGVMTYRIIIKKFILNSSGFIII